MESVKMNIRKHIEKRILDAALHAAKVFLEKNRDKNLIWKARSGNEYDITELKNKAIDFLIQNSENDTEKDFFGIKSGLLDRKKSGKMPELCKICRNRLKSEDRAKGQCSSHIEI